MILVLLLLAVSSPTGRAQMQPPAQAQGDAGLPDFSGFNLIDSFAKLPAERTNLSTLCDVRRTSIDEITGNIEGALRLADESADPAAAARLHNAMGVVSLYKGDVTAAIAQFEEGVRICASAFDRRPQVCGHGKHRPCGARDRPHAARRG
jgi:hypothetical protein